jgi:serine/threonine protein phosphatase PrpC
MRSDTARFADEVGMSEPDHATARIYVDQNHLEPELVALANGHATVLSRRSPIKATANEDAALLVDTGQCSGVLAVADGCGGMAAGEQASRLAAETLLGSIESRSPEAEGLRPAILDGIEHANRRVRQLGTGAATTLAAVEINHVTIRPYHVGDSSVLLVGNRGRVKLQTRAHSPVAYAVEAGVISEEEAIHHEDRHLVSNVLGTHDTHIEIGPRRRMTPRDTLLVASDGLFDNLHTEEIVDLVRKGPLPAAAAALAAAAAQRMEHPDSDHPSKPDDLTFILFRLSS